jgi:hypothetical protein
MAEGTNQLSPAFHAKDASLYSSAGQACSLAALIASAAAGHNATEERD